MATSRWSTSVVKVLLLVVVAAAVAILMVECNQTLVLAVTGGVTVGEDGVATKKTWSEVREVVVEEWSNQHNVQDIKDLIASIAKDAKLKARELANKASKMARKKPQQHPQELTFEPTNEAIAKEKAKEEYDVVLEKAAREGLDDVEIKVHVLTPKNEQDDDEL